MSKRSRALRLQRKASKKSQSTNAKRKQKYKSLAGNQSCVPSSDDYSANHEFKRKGLTKAQKKRQHMGKDPKGALGGIEFSFDSFVNRMLGRRR